MELSKAEKKFISMNSHRKTDVQLRDVLNNLRSSAGVTELVDLKSIQYIRHSLGIIRQRGKNSIVITRVEPLRKKKTGRPRKQRKSLPWKVKLKRKFSSWMVHYRAPLLEGNLREKAERLGLLTGDAKLDKQVICVLGFLGELGRFR